MVSETSSNLRPSSNRHFSRQNKPAAITLLFLLHVASGGIIRDTEVQLPSNEKIYKRSIEDLPETTTTPPEQPPTEPAEEDPEDLVSASREPELLLEAVEDFDGAESGIVFRPLFVYRNQQVRRRRFGRSAEGKGDLEGAESSIVFRPLFRYRYTQRRRAARRRQ